MFLFFDGNFFQADAGSGVLVVVIMIPILKKVKEVHHCLKMEQASALDAPP